MNRILAALVMISVVAVACGPNATPTTPPDVPLFADGEAIAVVKTRLSGMAFDSVQSVNPGIGVHNFSESRREPLEQIVVQRNCLPLYDAFEYQWSSEYLGKGVWSVTAETENSEFSTAKWRVFENTRTVDKIQSSFPLC